MCIRDSLRSAIFGIESVQCGNDRLFLGACNADVLDTEVCIQMCIRDRYKTMMTRLKQGEYIVQNPIFRSMLHIKFPKPISTQVK